MYNVSNPLVAISGAVHRELNDIVADMTKKNVGWRDNYTIYLGADGQIEATAVKPNPHGLVGLIDFKTGINKKLVFLPTPQWVRDSNQKVYICFRYELPEIMEELAKTYVFLLGQV